MCDGTFNQRLTPILTLLGSNVAQISSGKDHAFAIMKDGIVYGWGSNGVCILNI